MGLLRGREDLYGKSVLRALHVSPAPGAAILAGLVLAGLPHRLGTGLLLAAVTGWLLPAGALWWSMPLLWGAAVLSSLAGYAAALLALMGWVRVAPRSLAILWGIAVMVGLNLVIGLIGLMTVGAPAPTVAAVLLTVVPWLVAGTGGVATLPAVVLAIRAVLRPGRRGEWYREAYLTMQEMGDGGRQLRPSRWPRVLSGAAGALQARLWRELWLNWFTWVRAAVLLLLLGLLFWQQDRLVLLAGRFPAALVLGLGLTAAVGAFGEVPATVGSSDGPNIGLSMAAGVRAGQVVAAKWVACLPLALLSAACTWATAVLAEQPGLTYSLAAGCIGLGFAVVAMAGGLLDLDPQAEVVERDVPPILRAALEQIPRQAGGLIGYFGGVCFAVAAVWLCLRVPGALLPLAAGAAALAHVAAAAGYLRLKRLGM